MRITKVDNCPSDIKYFDDHDDDLENKLEIYLNLRENRKLLRFLLSFTNFLISFCELNAYSFQKSLCRNFFDYFWNIYSVIIFKYLVKY